VRLGRPRRVVDAGRIAALRSEGLAWATIAKQLNVGEGTIIRAVRTSAKNPVSPAPASPCSVAAD
jgi:hypothetical protein